MVGKVGCVELVDEEEKRYEGSVVMGIEIREVRDGEGSWRMSSEEEMWEGRCERISLLMTEKGGGWVRADAEQKDHGCNNQKATAFQLRVGRPIRSLRSSVDLPSNQYETTMRLHSCHRGDIE